MELIEDVDVPRIMPPKSNNSRFLRSVSKASNISALEDKEKRKSAKLKRTPKSTSETAGDVVNDAAADDTNDTEEGPGGPGGADQLEKELQRMMQASMAGVSRQRLRALQMALRRAGNTECRITQKDLLSVLQENQLKISGRAFQMLTELYEDSQGIDYERLWRSLVKAQNKSGRDSVLAHNKTADISSSLQAHSQEEQDEDLLTRLEAQFLQARDSYSLAALRAEFQGLDTDKAGRLKKEDMLRACTTHHLPIYGALLNALLNRCDEGNTGKSSWPDLMSYLDKVQEKLNKAGIVTKNNDSEKKEKLLPIKKDSTTSNAEGKDVVPEMSQPLKRQLVKSAFRKALAEEGHTAPLSPRPQVKAATGFMTSMRSLLKGKNKPESTIPAPSSPVPESKASTAVEFSSKDGLQLSSNAQSKPPQQQLSPKPNDRKPNASPSASQKSQTSQQEPSKSPVQLRPSSATPVNGILKMEIKGKFVTMPVPDDYKNAVINTDPPKERLKLEWIYGYRGNDCRRNIHTINSGEIVYFIGTTVILYNRDTHVQRHYREHTHDIKCMTVHPNRVTVATGQQETKHKSFDAHIRLWRSDTLQTLHILGMGTLNKSALCLSFSRISNNLQTEVTDEEAQQKMPFSQDRLCCVDDSEEHHLHVWDVSNGAFITSTPLSVETICDVDFNPTDPCLMVVIGKEHIGWWKLFPENKIIQLHCKADYQNYLRARVTTALLHNDRGDLITGDSNGTVYVWGKSGNIITNLIKHAHDGPIFSLLLTRSTLLTGGRDGLINGWWWSKNMDQTAQLKVPTCEGGVRVLQTQRDWLLIGTTTNSILSAKLAGQALRNPLSGVRINVQAFTQGHYDVVQVACAPVSTPHRVITAGRDGVIIIYDTEACKPVWKHCLKNNRIYCADIVQSGDYIVLGSRDTVSLHYIAYVLDDGQDMIPEEQKKWHYEMQQVFSVGIKLQGHRLTTVKMCPGGLMICAGDSEGALYKIGVNKDAEGREYWTVLNKVKGHDTNITGLDWSVERSSGVYLVRTSCSNLALRIWKVGNLEEVKNIADVRNTKWMSTSCKINYYTSGMWYSKQAINADISTTDVNLSGSLLAMGDSDGYLSLFRYPCTKKGASSKIQKAHSTKVFQARFLHEGVVTVGGGDTSVCQWLICAP